eukprot:837074-Pyramimonas_sp.AAC.1
MFGDVMTTWLEKRWGLKVGEVYLWRLTNLRFADDVMLINTSLNQIWGVLADIHTAAGKRGLELHPDKQRFFRTLPGRRGAQRNRVSILVTCALTSCLVIVT